MLKKYPFFFDQLIFCKPTKTTGSCVIQIMSGRTIKLIKLLFLFCATRPKYMSDVSNCVFFSHHPRVWTSLLLSTCPLRLSWLNFVYFNFRSVKCLMHDHGMDLHKSLKNKFYWYIQWLSWWRYGWLIILVKCCKERFGELDIASEKVCLSATLHL